MRATLELGGTLSGEHGIGLAKRATWPGSSRRRSLRLQRELKRVWDPDDLLNPGKISAAAMTVDVTQVRAKLAARSRMEVRLDGFRESAVLVPIVCEPDAPDRLLFTVRHAELANHAGQIAFPGGKRDPGDPDLPSTARRETSEELGIAPERGRGARAAR